MKMPDTVKVPMREVTKRLGVEVVVTGVRVFRARLWLGAMLFKLGARVIGCEITVREALK